MNWQRLLSLLEHTDAYGNSLRGWLIAAGIAALAGLTLLLIQRILSRRAKLWRERSPKPWMEALSLLLTRTKAWFLLILAIYCGSQAVYLPPPAAAAAASAAVIAFLVQAALWGDALVTFALARHSRKRLASDAASVTLISTLGFIGRLAMWTIVALLALENVGVNITALIAGLGIGGIAVALAAQNILGDLFASLSIVFDKPFVLGDFIIVGTDMGEVEHIGMKSTRVRTPGGDQLIFSNADLLKSRIRNCKRMTERRVTFTLSVAIDTPPQALAEIPKLVRQAIEGRDQVRFDRSHLKEIGAASLNFETVYLVTTPDNNRYLDVQQEIYLAILEGLASRGVELATPTQTVYIERANRPRKEKERGIAAQS